MASKIPYVAQPGIITKVLQKAKEAKTPDRFTYDFLETKLGCKGEPKGSSLQVPDIIIAPHPSFAIGELKESHRGSVSRFQKSSSPLFQQCYLSKFFLHTRSQLWK